MSGFEKKIIEEGTEGLKELSKLLNVQEIENSLRSLWEIVAKAKLFKSENITQVGILFHPEDQDNAAIEIKNIWDKVHDRYTLEELLEILKKNMILTAKDGEIRTFTRMDYSGHLNMGGYFSIRDFDDYGDTHNWDSIKKYILSKIE